VTFNNPEILKFLVSQIKKWDFAGDVKDVSMFDLLFPLKTVLKLHNLYC